MCIINPCPVWIHRIWEHIHESSQKYFNNVNSLCVCYLSDSNKVCTTYTAKQYLRTWKYDLKPRMRCVHICSNESLMVGSGRWTMCSLMSPCSTQCSHLLHEMNCTINLTISHFAKNPFECLCMLIMHLCATFSGPSYPSMPAYASAQRSSLKYGFGLCC